MRHLLVHYHLFKNAGSSVDQLLKNAFDDKWLSHDSGNNPGFITATELSEYIHQNPTARAISSHIIVPPLPTGNFVVHPIVLLRDPIARVMSAYLFEWKIQKNVEKPIGSLANYIEQKLELPRQNAIEDFQTMRLATVKPEQKSPDTRLPDAVILKNAINFIDSLPVFGLVERFNESLELFQRAYGNHYPSLEFSAVVKNTTQNTETPLHERHEKIKSTIGSALYEQLLLRNQMDIKLYQYALGRFELLKYRYQDVSDEPCSNSLMAV